MLLAQFLRFNPLRSVDDGIYSYELESLAQAGNLNSTPEYMLSMIEKTVNNATAFAMTFSLYLEGEKGSDYVDVIKGADQFAQSLSDLLTNVMGITRLIQNDETSDKLVAVAKTAGDVGLRFFLNSQSCKLDFAPAEGRAPARARGLTWGSRQAL